MYCTVSESMTAVNVQVRPQRNSTVGGALLLLLLELVVGLEQPEQLVGDAADVAVDAVPGVEEELELSLRGSPPPYCRFGIDELFCFFVQATTSRSSTPWG